MGVHVYDGRSRTLGALLRELAEGSTALIRQEAQLAKLELTEALRGIGKGTAFIVAGGVLLLLGALALLTGLILLGGDQWLRDRYWLAALIVTLVAGGVAAWFAKQGLALLSPRRLAPDETIASLKEDKEWLKHPLT
jgi:drug/metabolite transporter (DMT)-like permease